MAKKPTKAASKPSTPTYPVNPALEAAVIANAEDDTPRLVYADWLDENGDPDRAAFIRAQVALWDKNPADTDYIEAVARKAHLCELMRDRWWRLAPKLPNCLRFHDDPGSQFRDDEQAGFHRGFPYYVGTHHFPDDTTEQGMSSVLRDVVKSSTLRGLDIYSQDPVLLRSVLADPVAGAFSALTITNQDPDATGSGGTLPIVLASPICANLKWLNLSNVATPIDADLLANAKNLAQLRRFEGGLNCDTKPMQRVVASDWFGRLSHIKLDFGAGDAPTAIRGLAQLPNLHTLGLSRVPAAAVPAFSKARGFQTLGRIRLDRVALNTDGVQSLAKGRYPKLAVLELWECGVTDQHIGLLAGSSLFDGLRSFFCTDPLGNKGLASITASACAPQLQRMDVTIRVANKATLATMTRRLLSLVSLRLSDHPGSIAAPDIAAFLKNLASPNLQYLNLSSRLTDDCAKSIADNPALSELRSLELWGTEHPHGAVLSAAGILSLLTSPHLKRLERLLLRSDQTIAGVKTIQEVLSDPATLPELRQIGVSGYGPVQKQKKLEEAFRQGRPNLDILC